MTWRLLMMRTTPVSPDDPLDEHLAHVARQFDAWRQQRSHAGERIPPALWEQAVALAQTRSYSQVAKQLRLAPSDLKKQMRALPMSPAQVLTPPVHFVAVPAPPAPPLLRPDTELELERADGARLRRRSGDATLPLAALVRAFLETAS
jgi:hypothetical protein